MEYLSVAQAAEKWGISQRSVRNYCAQGRVPGAVLNGKTWQLPAQAEKPIRKNAANAPAPSNPLLATLREEKACAQKGGIYHKLQVELTYNSNHIEGSTLTKDQTRYIFETATIGIEGEAVRVDDIIETANHFRCIDYVIDHAADPLSQEMIKYLHGMLKASTTDSATEWFAVGDYKRRPNEIGGRATTPPEQVEKQVASLLKRYAPSKHHTLEDIIEFHVQFERIHPFQDGNGRIGRLIMLKECLANNIVPFVITENTKLFYYHGLAQWDNAKGYLTDTCLTEQDHFKEWLDYFRIPWE